MKKDSGNLEHRLNIRISEKLWNKLVEAARKKRMSASALARIWIEDNLNQNC